MRWIRPYLVAYRLELSKKFTYRTNFVFGRVRDLIVFGGLLYLYNALPHGAGTYDPTQLRTYTLLATFVFAVQSGFAMNDMADEIFSGDLSNYLLRPIKYYGYWLSRTLAHRSILVVSGLLEIGLLALLFQGQPLVVPTPVGALQFAVLLVIAVGIVQVIDFTAATLAIWTGRAFGSRFVTYGILIPFLSGAFVPLDILPDWARTALAWTPFPLTAFAPLQAYLGRLDAVAFGQYVLLGLAWIGAFSLVLALMWRKGARSYEAYGR